MITGMSHCAQLSFQTFIIRDMFLNILISIILLIYIPHVHISVFIYFIEFLLLNLLFGISILALDNLKALKIVASQFYHLKMSLPQYIPTFNIHIFPPFYPCCRTLCTLPSFGKVTCLWGYNHKVHCHFRKRPAWLLHLCGRSC
jgi:hypothetical protein